MKYIIKLFIFTAIFIIPQNINADNKYTLGLGLGSALYGGLGANVGVLSQHDMKYISAGVKSYGSFSGFTYGAGIGWIKTDLIETGSNKHGIGCYVGITDKEIKPTKNDIILDPDNYEYVYGHGLTYNYFFSGIDKSGTNLGFGLINSHYSNTREVSAFFAWGYQF